MGRNKQRHNWKARQVIETKIDKSEEKKIKIDLDDIDSKYDECNVLVLPSKKRKTIVKKHKEKITKLLTKSQRKKLEKIVDNKKKKENRAKLMESLSEVQIPSERLKLMTSITEVQTKGLKRCFNQVKDNVSKIDQEMPNVDIDHNTELTKPINSVKGSFKKRCLLSQMPPKQDNKLFSDPNVVGFEVNSIPMHTALYVGTKTKDFGETVFIFGVVSIKIA